MKDAASFWGITIRWTYKMHIQFNKYPISHTMRHSSYIQIGQRLCDDQTSITNITFNTHNYKNVLAYTAHHIGSY